MTWVSKVPFDTYDAASFIKDPAAIVAFAREKGLEITEDEAKEAISMLDQDEGELGAESLSLVAGGRRC